MEKKKKLIILGIITLTLVIIGTTYAILTWTSTKINLGLNSGCFTIDYTKGQDISGNLKLLNESDLISSNKFTIKNGIGISAVNIGINSTCTIEGFGSIYLNVTNISESFTTGDSKGALKYAVLSNTSTITTPSSVTVDSLLNQSFEIVAKGSIESSGKKLLYKMELSNTEINKYIIVIYVDNFLAGNSITSATFSGNISSEAEQKSPDYDANFEIETNEEDGTATIRKYVGQEKDVVIPKMLRKSTYTADVVSNPSEEVISACEDFFINGGMPSDSLGDICKNGKSGFRDMTLKEIITENILPLSYLQQLEKIGSITNLQTSYSSKKYVVTSIEEFSHNQLTSVTIPDSVTYLKGFFDNQLTNIIIPDSVTTIDNSAFYKNQITSVVFGDSVTTIGNNAFGDNKLINVIIPDSVTTIDNGAFYKNQITSVVFGNSITTIRDFAFSYNQLTNIIIPDSVTTIDVCAFSFNNLNYVYISGNSKLTAGDNIGVFSTSNRTETNNGITYVDNPNLKTIYNNSGKKFKWRLVTQGFIVAGETYEEFVTGNVSERKDGDTTYNAVTITTGQPS